MDKTKSKNISLGAIITVFSILILLLTSILVTSKVFLVCFTSFLISVLIIESNTKIAIVSYLSTVILGFMLVPNKLILVPYALFFGYYGIAKYYIERINKLALEYVIKLIIFDIYIFLNYKTLTFFIKDSIDFPVPIWIIVLGLQVFMLVYDYVFSLFISFYKQRIQKYLN